jgi:hypothetical protein
MNPRLSHEWLLYLVAAGAQHDADGWRWKLDASMRFGGFGPWRPEWTLLRLPGLAPPLLGFLASVSEPMGWDTTEEILRPHLPPGAEIVRPADTGHFIHIERRRGRRARAALPRVKRALRTADRPRAAACVRRRGALLLLHGRSQRAAGERADAVASWPGPIWALDTTGTATPRCRGGGTRSRS